MSFEAARLFCDMMAGVKFLHDNGWVHRDLKPGNVGVLMRDRYRAVSLDLGDAVQLPPVSKLDAAPGTNGTVNYLSPEREMTVYDHGEDVWSLGIIGYQLIYGYHPFMLARNPWRPGEAFEALRPTFQSHYSDAITRLRTHYEEFVKRGHRTQNPSFVHFGGLLIGMLRHSWSTKDSRIPRTTINEALQHGSVKDVLGHDDEDRSKRYRAVA